jgi:hypothetical protein
MADAWDWRQSYVEYSATPEIQDLQPTTPRGPEVLAPGQEPYAAPYGRPQDTVQPPASGPYAGPYSQYVGYSPTVAAQGARAFSIAAFICGGFALLFLPFILGPLGITFGFVANSKGHRMGRWAGLISIATTVLGIALSFWVSSNVGLPLAD